MTTIKDKYINPFTDFGFKRIFGEEAQKELLMDFLNALLEGEHVIESLQYKKNDYSGKTLTDRKAIFDLYCVTSTGEHIIIELQKATQEYFKDRSVYYSTFPIQSQAPKGAWNYELKSVYTIGILNFTIDDTDRDKPVVKDVMLMDKTTKKVFYDKLHYIYLQMPNFEKQESDLISNFDKWLYVLKNLSQLTHRPAVLSGRIFERLFKVAEIAKFTPKQMEAYEQSIKEHLDLLNVLDTAELKGRIEGIMEGRMEGRIEGEQIGLQKGRMEGEQKKTHQIIINSHKAGLSIDTIAQITGLGTKEILSVISKLRLK